MTALSTAKAIAAVSCQRGQCREFLRVQHKEREMSGQTLNVLTVPTTARYYPSTLMVP